MGGRQEAWRADLPIQEYLRGLGVDIDQGVQRGRFLATPCPLHEDDGKSFSISIQGALGEWECRDGCGHGALEHLIALKTGQLVQSARAMLHERFDPLYKRADKVKRIDPLPTNAQIKTWQSWLWTEKSETHSASLIIDYLNRHAIDLEFARDTAMIGCENGVLMLPVFDRAGNVVQLKKRAVDRKKVKADRPKDLSLAGRGSWLYPAHHHLFDKPPIIVEGEMDALACASVGLNAITSTVGAASWKAETFWPVVQRAAGSVVTLIYDKDGAGQRACVRLAQELQRHEGVGMVRVVTVPDPHKDVADWLATIPPAERETQSVDLIKAAPPWEESAKVWNNVASSEGSILLTSNSDRPDEILAPFTGYVTESGVSRDGTGGHSERVFTLRLLHKSGAEIDVVHEDGQDFSHSIMATRGSGPQWKIEGKHADKVFTYLCQVSQGSENIDRGWFFGWEGRDFSRFWTKDHVFTDGGEVIANTEVRMQPPTAAVAAYGLPNPEADDVRVAMDLVMGSMLHAHEFQVMAPAIVSAFAAPVRRLLIPNENRWAIYLIGGGGACKTSRARLVQNLFGLWPTDNDLLAFGSVGATPKALVDTVGRAGDSLVVIDDYSQSRLSEREWGDARQFMQGVAQGRGRIRLRKDGSFIDPPVSSAIVMVTGESMPADDQSQIARALVVRVPKINPLEPRWRTPCDDVWANFAKLPAAIAGWIKWWLASTELRASMAGRMKTANDSVLDVLEDSQPGWAEQQNAPRMVSRIAMYSAMWEALLDFAVACGAITAASKEIQVALWWDHAIPHLVEDNFSAIEESGVAQDAMTQIISNLQGGKAFFATSDEQPWPRGATAGATRIGYIDRGGPGQKSAVSEISSVVIWKGSPARVYLDSSAALILKGTWRWATLRAYLVDSGMAVDKQAKILGGMQRALLLTKKGAQALLDADTAVISQQASSNQA